MYSVDDIITFIILGAIAFVVPGGLTIWNIYNLFAKQPKKEVIAFWMTVIIGGFLYILLYDVAFNPAGDWWEVIEVTQTHYSISTQYVLGVVLPALVGFVGLVVLACVKAEKKPPLVSVFSVAAVILLNIVQIVYAVQISKNVLDDGFYLLFFYVYHFNIFILSVSTVKKQMNQQLEIFKQIYHRGEEDVSHESRNSFINRLYLYVNNISRYSGLIFICFFFLIAILEIIFILAGQGAAAPLKAFTDTADWTFSKQIPPPPIDYQGHYLCTVAAGGHKKIVKPLRYGTRRGVTIIVNRQLSIANAFEEYIQEKLPKFHRFIRGVYDKYGYPISKHITTPSRADIVYIIMKPLEWAFLVFLYLFDIRPEQRISRQYLYNGKE